MSANTSLHESSSLSPDDWPTEAEREYARRLDPLAEEHGVDLDSRVVDTDAVGRVHYLVGGDPDGDPVVLLHGLNVPGATWIPMLPALADDYCVYVPDRPGVGLTDPHQYSHEELRSDLTAYLVEFFDRTGLERPHVVANSLGGLQAFLLAVDHDRAGSLCLVGAPVGLTTDIPAAFRLLTIRGLNGLLYWFTYRGDPVGNARDQMRAFSVVDDAAISREYYDLLAAHQGLSERLQSERSLALAQSSWFRVHDVMDVRDDLVDVDRPTCFVWGAEDETWSPEVGQPVAADMPDADFHELPGHGHMPWLEPDEDASDAVRAFLDERGG